MRVYLRIAGALGLAGLWACSAGVSGAPEPESCREGCVVQGDAMLGWVNAQGGRLRLEPAPGACAELVVPPGAVAEDTPISLRTAFLWPPSPDLVPNTVYRLSPEGVAFDPPVSLSICYSPEELHAGWSASELTVHRAVDGVWQDLGGQSDAEVAVASTELSSFALTSNLVAVMRPILDRAPPVVSIEPPPESTLHGTSLLTVTFDEPVQPDSLVLSGTLGKVSPVVIFSDSRRRVQLSAVNAWPHGPEQTLTVQATDDAGNTGSTTFVLHVDAEAPSFVVTPQSGQELAPHRAVTVQFSETMQLGGFELGGELGAESDGGLLSSSTNAYDTLSIGPVGTWSPGSNRELWVRAVDAAGNPVQIELRYSIDGTAPTATVTPPTGSRLPADGAVEISFSKSMAPSTLVLGGELGPQATTTWSTTSLANDTLQLLPPSRWSESAAATLEVTAADEAGNPVQVTAIFVVDESPAVATLVLPEAQPLDPKSPIVIRFSESMEPTSLRLRGHLGRAAGPPSWSVTDTTFVNDTLTLSPDNESWPQGLARELWIDVADLAGHLSTARWALDVGTTCGNGTLDPGESCDTAGASATCDADCTAPMCGDGEFNLEAGEVCDDGNTLPGDGCASDCMEIEVGYVCEEAGAACEPLCTEDCTALLEDTFTNLDASRWAVVASSVTVEPNGLRLGANARLSSAEPHEPYERDGLQVELQLQVHAPRVGIFVRAGTDLYLGRPAEAVGVELWSERDRAELKVYPPAGFALGDTGASPSEIDSRTLAMLNHPATLIDDLAQHVSINTATNLMQYRNGPDGIPNTADDKLFNTMAEVDAVEGVAQISLDALRLAGELWSPPGLLSLQDGDELRVVIDDSGAGVTARVTHLGRNETVTMSTHFPVPGASNLVVIHTMGAGEITLRRAVLRTLRLYQCTGPLCDATGTCQLDQPLYAGKSCDDGDPSTSGEQCDGAGACVEP